VQSIDPRRHFCLASFFFFSVQVMEIIKRAGIPDGVVQIVNGTVPVVEAICDHPDIPAISFVGSSKVAEIVAHRGRKNNKRVLALGAAKNHLVALRDCNADMCSTDIMQSFTGCAGQRCMAASALITVDQRTARLLDRTHHPVPHVRAGPRLPRGDLRSHPVHRAGRDARGGRGH
jgi:malonate-semialdehyde dehydrogenase (acetylating)/methylmalonate-semialdehyde dehydrogenase